MNFKTNVVFVIFLGVVMSCSTVKYWTDYTKDVDFSQYHTYMIDDQCSDYSPGVNPINQQRIKNAIELELRDIGYSRAEDPDLNVKFFIKNETKYFYENCISEYDDLTGGNQCIEKMYTYEEGTLVIDLIDIKRNLAIWHGGSNGDSWEDLKNPDAQIKKMVQVIFKEYQALTKRSGYASTD